MAECIRKITTLLSATALVAGLSACESTGSTRFSSVGSGGLQGPQGAPGPQGPAGPAGPSGQGGTGLGSAGALAVGGLVGPNGVAGTGLLANTGDPNSRIPAVSGVLVATGGVVRTVAGQGTILANVVDAHAPGGIPLAGTVIGVVDATGQALIRTGNGQERYGIWLKMGNNVGVMFVVDDVSESVRWAAIFVLCFLVVSRDQPEGHGQRPGAWNRQSVSTDRSQRPFADPVAGNRADGRCWIGRSVTDP